MKRVRRWQKQVADSPIRISDYDVGWSGHFGDRSFFIVDMLNETNRAREWGTSCVLV